MTYDPIVYDPNAQCESIYKPGFSVSLDNWRFRLIANSPPKSFNLFVMAEQTSFSVEIVIQLYQHGFSFSESNA